MRTAILIAIGLASLRAQSPYAAGSAAVKEGRFGDAIVILEKVVANSPGDLKARNLLGIALMSSGRIEDARTQFQKALAADPSFLAALKNLAVAEMSLGHTAEARRHFEKLLSGAPDDPVAHLYLSELEFAAGRFREAVAHYRRSGGLHLKDPATALHFARAALKTDAGEEAARALENASLNAAQQFEAGILFSEGGRPADAARHFELAAKGPEPYPALFNLALMYFNARDYAAAVRTAELLAADHPTAELHNLLARAYEALGRTQDAYDSLRTATRLDPADERNYIDLMSLCLTHRNWNLSLEISAVALERVARPYRIRLQRGAVYALRGELEEASKEFDAALQLDARAGVPVVALALIDIERKSPETAIQRLRNRRAAGPPDYLVAWFLAESLAQQDRNGESLSAVQEAVRLNPSHPGPHVLMGKLLVRSGDLKRAQAEFETALKLKPDEHNAAYQLALIYRKAGDLARAEELMAIVQKKTSVEGDRRVDLVNIIQEASK